MSEQTSVQASQRGKGPLAALGNAERDVVTFGIAVAALIMFVGTTGTLMPQIIRASRGLGASPDMLLTNAMLLNIALLLFGWRRYRDLQREMTVRREAEETARELAQRDPLTHCLNRRSGVPALQQAIATAAQDRCDLAVLMLDLDNFKQINDLHSHSAGDAVLVEIAARINAMLPKGGMLARMGGDEFACCLPVRPGEDASIHLFASRLLDSVAAPMICGNAHVEASVSAGIVLHRRDLGTPDEAGCELLIHRADIAMYHAKKTGRNRYTLFEPRLEDDLHRRNVLGSAIRAGIDAGEFVPFYEQQIDLATGELVGFEMLARWQSPQYGLVMPDTFIPVAEDLDLIAPLSECLIRQALADARDWDPCLTLSVNISPVQLRDPWFAQKILKLLVDTGFPAGRLELEITESCMHENIAAVRSILAGLKNQGIRISLDDFGTGYSSLSQLRELPFDRIKIDRTFVKELASDGTNDMMNAIVALGRGLNLPITAEGIETPEVLEMLRELGELKGQGYLYGMPEDAETTRGRLAGMELLNGVAPTIPAALQPDRQRIAG